MSILSRLKRLWALSEYEVQQPEVGNPWIVKPTEVVVHKTEEGAVMFGDGGGGGKPVGEATVVQDDPLDVFPPEDEQEKQS